MGAITKEVGLTVLRNKQPPPHPMNAATVSECFIPVSLASQPEHEPVLTFAEQNMATSNSHHRELATPRATVDVLTPPPPQILAAHLVQMRV